MSYTDVLTRRRPVGSSVAVIGAGGIGFDVSEFLLHHADAMPHPSPTALVAPSFPEKDSFLREWGINPDAMATRGGLMPGAEKASEEGGREAEAEGGGGEAKAGGRKMYLLQRKKGKLGAGLGRTTGWIHRVSLKKGGVEMIGEGGPGLGGQRCVVVGWVKGEGRLRA
jgi:2,4-dienoyl-CoA reductase (NADPH2)